MWFFKRPDTSVLMVCTANICRSPMAAGVMQSELRQRGLRGRIVVESAGTHATQSGRGADPRALKICAGEGINLARSRARQLREDDFSRFGHILAMDKRNLEWLLERSPLPNRERISLITSWAPDDLPDEIPDPYYGNLAGFDQVLSMLQIAVRGFLGHFPG